ncbi:MAG: polysaccharide pyruvyl transferase family protein [Syntrophomonas sp.]
MYMHSGSLNHGCEAIVRASCKILKRDIDDITLFSDSVEEDLQNGLDLLCRIKGNRTGEIKPVSAVRVAASLSTRLFKSYYFQYQDLIKSSGPESMAFSIGGDNYCYAGYPVMLASVNKLIKDRGAKTVLWGCSIEPEVIAHDVVDDLNRYDLITARETITYNALIEKGVHKNTVLIPDPAFVLDTVERPLPEGFIPYNTVGINISPLIMKLEQNNNITYQNYANLMKHIIDNSDMQIALIPHVTWEDNNDLVPLQALYDQFKETDRVVIIPGEYNCSELKGFISRCRIFVGARTHATIAAYSTGVPTLVVGYSVKARGIARDIFNTDEGMVIPVQSLKGGQDLVNAFRTILESEDWIKSHLNSFMPSYVERVMSAGEEVKKL